MAIVVHVVAATPRSSVLLSLLLSTAWAVAAVFDQGAWWARLPLKNSLDFPSSTGDLNATLDAIAASKMSLVGFDAEVCGTASTKGDTGTGGVGIGDLVAFLDRAAVRNPGLRVFATLSSHHPIQDYCEHYLNDAKTDVNWTRVGIEIANRTLGRSNFMGIYIDDFYVMMCTPEAQSFSRHGSTAAIPCVPVGAIDNMRRAMRSINPRLVFFPLVYHIQTQYIVPNSYVLGAGQGVPFLGPARASVSVEFPNADEPQETMPRRPTVTGSTLRFFYLSYLNFWNKGSGHPPVNGTVMFEARVNGHVLLSVDAASIRAVQLFQQDVSQWIGSGSINVSFATFPTTLASHPEYRWMIKDCYKTSYVYGVELGTSSIGNNKVRLSTIGGPDLLAREPTESKLTDHAEAIMFQREQDPAKMLSPNDYAHLAAHVKASNPHSSVYGGHYSRLGMPWDIPVSAKALQTGIAADRQAMLAGAMVFEMPLMVGQCRSRFDACCDGVFHKRQLPSTMSATAATVGSRYSELQYNGLLFWPNEAVALPGWYQRFATQAPVPSGRQLSLSLSDSRTLSRHSGAASLDQFRKRVVGLDTGTVYYDSPVGLYINGTATCGASVARCPGSSLEAKCEIVCSGAGFGTSNITVTTAHTEPVAVELRTGSMGSTHALTTLQVLLPPLVRDGVADDNAKTVRLNPSENTSETGSDPLGWSFSAGLDDDHDLSLRALFNVTHQAFTRGAAAR